jgi:hypothetical protein
MFTSEKRWLFSAKHISGWIEETVDDCYTYCTPEPEVFLGSV